MTDMIEVSPAIVQYAIEKMDWDRNPQFNAMVNDLLRLVDAAPVVISREMAEYAFNKMSWDASPAIREMGKVLRKLLDAAPVAISQEVAKYALDKLKFDSHPEYLEMAEDLRKVLDAPPAVKAESEEIAELRAELERIRNLNHNQILAEAAGRHLLESGAKNYVGQVFTIELDDGSEQFEVVVTTQKVNGQSLHDRLVASEQRNADLVALLKGLPEEFKDLSGSEFSAGVAACIEYTQQVVAQALKTLDGE